MPSIDGGPQNSKEYSPHLYNKSGEYIGNSQAHLWNEYIENISKGVEDQIAVLIELKNLIENETYGFICHALVHLKSSVAMDSRGLSEAVKELDQEIMSALEGCTYTSNWLAKNHADFYYFNCEKNPNFLKEYELAWINQMIKDKTMLKTKNK